MFYAQETRTIVSLPILMGLLLWANHHWHIGLINSFCIVWGLSLPLLIHYTARIGCGLIHYEIRFLRWTIHRKNIKHEDIREIHFKRHSWKQKGALLRMRNGKRLRLFYFKSDELMEKIEVFSQLYKVDVVKSKDYRLLERMDKSKKRP